MLRLYTSFLKQALFWLLFFALGRAVFLLYYGSEALAASDTFSEILLSFIKGFNLDLATTCYFMMFPFAAHIVTIFWSGPIISRIIHIYHSILIIAYSSLISSELGIYAEWKTKINYKALLYLQNPSEVMNTAQTSQILGFSLLTLLLSVFGIWIYNRYFHSKLIRIHTPLPCWEVFGICQVEQ